MNCEALTDHYELYAMGVAEEPERSEIREHLERHCPDCLAGVKRARQLAAILGTTAPPAAPSGGLRHRILASVQDRKPRFNWTPVWATAAVLAVGHTIFSGIQTHNAEQNARAAALENVRLRAQADQQGRDLLRLTAVLAILNGPDTTEVSFGKGQPAPPKGKVFVNPTRGVALLASNLPPAPAGKVYEMWLIPKAGNPAPAGLFQSDASGAAVHIQAGAVDMRATGAVAVTLENEGGAAQPTSTPIIVAAL